MGRLSIALPALALSATVACGYSAPTDAQNPPPPPPAPNDIDIAVGAQNLTTTAFSPNPKVVSLGGNASVDVRWVNTDISGGNYTNGTATSHSIVSDNGAFPASATLAGNVIYSITLNAAGSYPYHCGIHPNMVGTITVNP